MLTNQYSSEYQTLSRDKIQKHNQTTLDMVLQPICPASWGLNLQAQSSINLFHYSVLESKTAQTSTSSSWD